tara:strand:- start:1165 stop:1398 length:234 start_codon:yes stop_codon:yes gene_type:complete
MIFIINLSFINREEIKMSMLLQEAKNKLIQSSNRSLINFIQQRECQSEPSELLKIAYQEVQKRQAQEFKALFSGFNN